METLQLPLPCIKSRLTDLLVPVYLARPTRTALEMAFVLAIWELASVILAGKDPIVLARLEHQIARMEYGTVLLEFVSAMLDSRESIVI